MNNSCFANDHYMEFRQSSEGYEYWYCLDCGETVFRYTDTGCGG